MMMKLPNLTSLMTALLLLAAACLPARAQYSGTEPAPRATMEGICDSANNNAKDKNGCKTQIRGKMLDNSAAKTNLLPANGGWRKNTEGNNLPYEPNAPFSISVDGENLPDNKDPKQIIPYKSGRIGVDAKAAPADKQRQADLDLYAADIQVKFDGGELNSELNVTTNPIKRSYKAGEAVHFSTFSNYPDFITKAEIRIHRRGRQETDKPLAIIPVTINGGADWAMPPRGQMAGDNDPITRYPDEYVYVLRVYDRKARFDETQPLSIVRTAADVKPDAQDTAEIAPGFSEDRTAVRNIPLNGGEVTVFGRHVPENYQPRAFGQKIPLDKDHQFVMTRILPPGEHMIDVKLAGGPGGRESGLHVRRAVNIPDNDWFYVGLADITLGKRIGDHSIEEVRPGEYEKVYNEGRLAFYLKGKIKGQYLLTASADTTEDKLRNIFKNIDRKDAKQLLRRLDPNDYYPVYGDDSTFTEDAPTKGRFYVRLDKGDSHVMWGSSSVSIDGTELLRSQRELYGANAVYRSPESTGFGAKKTEATAYGSQPETLSERQEFLATGGSSYFMKRQDIVRGSETVSVETRDETTGRLIDRHYLTYGEDYTFDYMQGVLLLQHPLSSTVGAQGAVRDGALGGQKVYVLTNYDYIPTVGNVHGYSYGGRVQHWFGDTVRIGATGMAETTGPANQKAYGADIKLRHSDKTSIEGELAHSKGPGFNVLQSTDGGLTDWTQDRSKQSYKGALSWRMRGELGLADVFGQRMGDSSLGGYYERKKAGYSSLSEEITADQTIWGADSTLELSKKTAAHLTYDSFNTEDGRKKYDGAGTLTTKFNDLWSGDVGLRYTQIGDAMATQSGYNGKRTDIGGKLQYRPDDDKSIYLFGQGSLAKSGNIDRNDRGGLGGTLKLTDTIGLGAEASYGTRGLGALATLDYNPNADDHYYIGYKLDPSRAYQLDRDYYTLHDTDRGTIVAGMKRRINDVASIYAENNYDLYKRQRSTTQTYGVNYTPNNLWNFSGGLEMGRVRNAAVSQNPQSDFDRYAPSFSFAYKNEDKGLTAGGRTEIRLEKSQDDTRNQISYLFSGGASVKTSKDWRLIGNIDAAIANARSDKAEAMFTDTDYAEASLGYAYRPIENDRLNGLIKYTWLYDMPGNNQRAGGDNDIDTKYGGYYAPAQKSHIFSADFTYDLYPWLSVGGKYGLRLGKVKYREDDNKSTEFNNFWQKSTAHLGVVRADFHWIKNWDMLLEGRMMYMPEPNTKDFGALAAVYRHVGDNFKVGAGYNFGRFSDDLRNQIYNDRGFFVNFIGKF